jgi:drug/metabolite transporter (DMT)-like permease
MSIHRCRYASNTSLIVFNKLLLTTFEFRRAAAPAALAFSAVFSFSKQQVCKIKEYLDHLCRFPITLACLHMLTAAILGNALSAGGVFELRPIASARTPVILLALLFGCGIVFGNVALQLLPVSFEQALSATTPAFVAVFALCFFNTREGAKVYLTIVPVIGECIACH